MLQQLAAAIREPGRARVDRGFGFGGDAGLLATQAPWRDVVVFNAFGAVVLAMLFSALGFVFGRAISKAIDKITHCEAGLAWLILAAGMVWLLVFRLRRSRSSNPR